MTLMHHRINQPEKHIESNDPRPEFASVARFCRGLGFDIGCGTNRLSTSVLSTDCYPHRPADLLWNCVAKEKIVKYPFQKEVFDFVFSSHVLEDFMPEMVQPVFDEWLRLVKPGGYLIILVPDMEGGRYPDWDEKFTEADEEVKSNERTAGETKGNPAHRVTMGISLLSSLIVSHPDVHVIQADSLDHSQMTLDFVVKKSAGMITMNEPDPSIALMP